jgi:hypothetical protein
VSIAGTLPRPVKSMHNGQGSSAVFRRDRKPKLSLRGLGDESVWPTCALRAAVIATTWFGGSIAASPTRALEPIGDADRLGARIAAAEGQPGRNPLSSAAGYGQFLSGTWLEIFERAYPQVAQTMTCVQILGLRDIKPLAEDLTNRYAQANAATLRSVGLPASAGELSLAHAIGPRGAVSVLTAESARPAAELLRPAAIAANPLWKEMTASALRQWAAIRTKAPAERSPQGGAANTQLSVEPLRPADDFRLDGRTKSSEALVTNHDAGAVLQDLVDALSKRAAGRARRSLRRRRSGFYRSGSSQSSCCAATQATARFSTESPHAHCSLRSAKYPTDRPLENSKQSRHMLARAASYPETSSAH